MNVADMILYLRQQLLSLRTKPDRRATAELLATFKMLTRAAYEQNNKALIAVLVDLTDSTRDVYMGKPLNGRLPAEARIRAATTVAYKRPAVAATVASQTPLDPEDTQPLDTAAVAAALEVQTETPAPAPGDRNTLKAKLRAVAQRDWADHTPMRDGDAQQAQAYNIAHDQLNLFQHLAAHDPMWVGTFPISVHIDSSDIDVICNPTSLRQFIADTRRAYGEQKDFKITWKALRGVPTVIARFNHQDLPIELFAQPKPVHRQEAYQHMIAEARLLAIGGETAQKRVRQLKNEGLHTEPAFSAVFQLKHENPYLHLLTIAAMDDDTLLTTLGC